MVWDRIFGFGKNNVEHIGDHFGKGLVLPVLAFIPYAHLLMVVFAKIVQYEKVHEVPTWRALKQRLGPGRLCYSFFHRGMPQEPLTFVQVALTKEIASNVQVRTEIPLFWVCSVTSTSIRPRLSSTILVPKRPTPRSRYFTPSLRRKEVRIVIRTRTSLLYANHISISFTGLSGVDLGNFLIKRVVKEMQTFLPSVKTFCTLSPIPKFRNWLETTLNQGPEGNESLLLDEEVEALRNLQTEGAHPVEVLRVSGKCVDLLGSGGENDSDFVLRIGYPCGQRLAGRRADSPGHKADTIEIMREVGSLLLE